MGLAARRRRERNRQAQRALLQVGKWLLLIAVFIAIGYGAHETGTKLARVEVEQLNVRLAELEQHRALLDEQANQLRAELEEARVLNRQLQQRYEAEVPRGALAATMAVVRERLAGGLNNERLRQVIRTAEPVRRCDGPTISRRFRIGVGSRATEDDSTSFAEGMIRVSALVPAVSDDLARATAVTFSGLGTAVPRTVTGLPVEHIVTVNNLELRLSVSESPVRGFATASLTTCRTG